MISWVCSAFMMLISLINNALGLTLNWNIIVFHPQLQTMTLPKTSMLALTNKHHKFPSLYGVYTCYTIEKITISYRLSHVLYYNMSARCAENVNNISTSILLCLCMIIDHHECSHDLIFCELKNAVKVKWTVFIQSQCLLIFTFQMIWIFSVSKYVNDCKVDKFLSKKNCSLICYLSQKMCTCL